MGAAKVEHLLVHFLTVAIWNSSKGLSNKKQTNKSEHCGHTWFHLFLLPLLRLLHLLGSVLTCFVVL